MIDEGERSASTLCQSVETNSKSYKLYKLPQFWRHQKHWDAPLSTSMSATESSTPAAVPPVGIPSKASVAPRTSAGTSFTTRSSTSESSESEPCRRKEIGKVRRHVHAARGRLSSPGMRWTNDVVSKLTGGERAASARAFFDGECRS